MKIIYSLSISAFLFVACSDKSVKTDKPVKVTTDSIVENAKDYQNIMLKKDISLQATGECDDALMDTLHKRNVAYIEKEQLTDTTIIVDFKFKEACCQIFGGDYTVSNDTLIFMYEQTNTEVCTCICWYRYKLKIGKLPSRIKRVLIKAVE